MNKIYVGDVGVLVQVDTGQSMSSAAVHEIHVKYPDNTTAIWTASINGNIIEYVTQASDLSQAGRYKIQAYIEMGAYKGFGDTTTLNVVNRGS